jgi:hypothetical protein
MAMPELFSDVHPSEWAWISSGDDYVIYNDGTLDELAGSIRKVIDSMTESGYNSSIDKQEGVL